MAAEEEVAVAVSVSQEVLHKLCPFPWRADAEAHRPRLQPRTDEGPTQYLAEHLGPATTCSLFGCKRDG